jgi:hypothetical protein
MLLIGGERLQHANDIHQSLGWARENRVAVTTNNDSWRSMPLRALDPEVGDAVWTAVAALIPELTEPRWPGPCSVGT